LYNNKTKQINEQMEMRFVASLWSIRIILWPFRCNRLRTWNYLLI